MSTTAPEHPTPAGTRPAGAGPTKRLRPFSFRDKIGYMFGDWGNDFTFILQSTFFMIFYTNVMGISAAHVGTLLFVARILDAFTDVGAGRLIDVLKPGRSGRFKPWLLRIMIPVTASAFLMFSPFLQGGGYGMKVAWMVVTYVLWGSIFYTLINIPYGSMASVISNDPGHRASLSVFRSLGGTLANLAISVILPLIVFVQVSGQSEMSGTRMMWAALGCGVLAVVCYLLCFVNVEERVATAPKPEEERQGLAAALGSMVTNRALTGLIATALFMLIAFMMLGGMMPYLLNEYFNNGQLLSVVNFVGLVPTLLLVPVASKLARTYGKKEIGAVGLTLGILAGAMLFVIRTDSPYVFMVGYALLMLGVAALNILIWAFITDVIDLQEIRTGERNDATVYGMYSWSRKLGQAIAGGLTGWALGWIGYQSGGGGQSQSVLDGIYTLGTLVPALLLLVSLLALVFWYPLTKKRVDENVALLEERHAAADASAARP
ncbi:sugar (glycoside-pentoside-Hexuronide) transporter [Brachybacterium ginsengisoli]|uniref:Sugar (Glycoside-pentoside-Hexuronide) transporter n=1 Tax=Brachybacterium ginsengisoli TaxID=1331682 RepID=A0A291H255_9MICO|nr:glycoside-pentoside-hexuronide (GPH):cation symporter [Brachybacterium ginsengisoli]ATG56490.1 sugar (glycoside-pentoside-Hexuronide) transporter [Brachybacterium ginsengisoli]